MNTIQILTQTVQRFLYPLLVSILCIFCALLGTPSVSEGRLTITIPPLDPDELPGTGNLGAFGGPPGKTITFTELYVTVPAQHSGGTLSAALDYSKVTKHKGYCINHGSTTDYDIKLLRSDNDGWSQAAPGASLTREIDGFFPDAESTETERKDGPWTIVVRCYDSAAYGELTLSTVASHGRHSVTLTIPRDDNGNKIADGWRNDAANNYNGGDDDEVGPGATTFTDHLGVVHNIPENTNNGDGLTVLDEYRGARLASENRTTRFSPRLKEIFIKHNDNAIAGLGGCGNGVSFPFTCWPIDTPSVVVNPNTKSGNMAVIAIEIKTNPQVYEANNQQDLIEWYGHAVGDASVPEPSLDGIRPSITIYTSRIARDIMPPGTIARVLSHEIGHCVNLDHCDSSPIIDELCLMDPVYDGNRTRFGAHHNTDYDLIFPFDDPQASGDIRLDETPITVISTNTGSSSYGCSYNSEYDYCTDTGTCGSWTDSSTNGLCGHRWCQCPSSSNSGTSGNTNSNTIISTNTGTSSNGCDYNAEYDYCSDTGSCTTTSDSTSNGVCGHRYCLCANSNGSSTSGDGDDEGTTANTYGCGQSEYADYCNDQGSCTIGSSSGVPSEECGENYCCCP